MYKIKGWVKTDNGLERYIRGGLPTFWEAVNHLMFDKEVETDRMIEVSITEEE